MVVALWFLLEMMPSVSVCRREKNEERRVWFWFLIMFSLGVMRRRVQVCRMQSERVSFCVDWRYVMGFLQTRRKLGLVITCNNLFWIWAYRSSKSLGTLIARL